MPSVKIVINNFDTLQQLHYEKMGSILKEDQKLSLLQLNIIGQEKKYPSQKDDWKIFGRNNLTIALNFLYAKKERNICSLHFKTQLKA